MSGRWLLCVERTPPAGVHRVTGMNVHVEQTFKLGRFQHFDGSKWGAIANDEAEAAELAATPTQFKPFYWLAPEGVAA
jgi:hypothetical protein